MTLNEYIKTASIEDIAKILIIKAYNIDSFYVFNGGGKYLEDRIIEAYFTTDGLSFYELEQAIVHQIELLNTDYNILKTKF